MIIVTIQKSGNTWNGFTSIGHANYDRHGSDIVCSAVSVLLINTINSIEQFSPDTVFKIIENKKEGLINYTLISSPDEKVELLLDSMLLGLKTISKKYKENVKLKFEEV